MRIAAGSNRTLRWWVLLICPFLCCERISATADPPKHGIEGVKKVIFERDDLDANRKPIVRKVEVTNSKHLAALMNALVLVPKRQCACAHTWRFTFLREKDTLTGSVCDHCFDISGGGLTGNYRMPPQFYRLFCSLTGQPQPIDDK
jgi:hypothetical protein